MRYETTIQVVHVEFSTDRSFDEVVASFEQATGDIQDGGLVRELAASRDLPDFENRMHAHEATSSFTLS